MSDKQDALNSQKSGNIMDVARILNRAAHGASQNNIEQKRHGESAALTIKATKLSSGFPFLSLPPEIRNIIYELALARPGYHLIECRSEAQCTVLQSTQQKRSIVLATSIYHHLGRRTRRLFAMTSCPSGITLSQQQVEKGCYVPTISLFLVSKKVRTESLPVFWGQNEFRPTCACILAPFLHDQPQIVQSNLRRLSIPISLSRPATSRGELDPNYYAVDYEVSLWTQGLNIIATHLRLVELDIVVHDYREEYMDDDPWGDEEHEPDMQWVCAARKIRGLKRFGFVYAIWWTGIHGAIINWTGDFAFGSLVHKMLGWEIARKVLLEKGEKEEDLECMQIGRIATDYVRIE